MVNMRDSSSSGHQAAVRDEEDGGNPGDSPNPEPLQLEQVSPEEQ